MAQVPQQPYAYSMNYGTQGQVSSGSETVASGSSYQYVPTKSLQSSSVEKGAAYVAEFVGTFVLVFAVGSNCMIGNSSWGPVAIGSVLTALIYSLGALSGGNFNPAVSMTLACIGALKWTLAMGYIIMQCLGGVLAGICVAYLFPSYELLMPFQPLPSTTPGMPASPPTFSIEYCEAAETLYTTMLCFVVASVAASKRNNKRDDPNQFYALAIGAVIIAGGYAVGGASGAMFNPAVALGLNIAQMSGTWGLQLVLGQLVGSAIAASVYTLIRPDDFLSLVEFNSYEPRLAIKCLSEFIGTFFLVVTVGLNVVMGSAVTAFSAAAALMSMIYSLGDVSGAHFNPAVTLAVTMRGRCHPLVALSYVISQLCGAACAAAVYAAFHDAGPNSNFTFGLAPGANFTMLQAGIMEMFATAVLCFTVLSVATTPIPSSFKTQQRFYVGLAISSCVTAGGFAMGGVSGGSLNPAVSAGFTFANLMHHGVTEPPPLSYVVMYSVWELGGAAIAAALFYILHPEEFHQKSFEYDVIL